MKNLFDYATKELSQDAFLAWLFANYDCEQEEVKLFSRFLLCSFIGKDNENISNLQVHKQKNNIDLYLSFNVSSEPYVLVIEDKIMSSHHDNQLEKYENIITKNFSSANKIFIYYKSSLIGKEEKQDLEKYENWKSYDITQILKIFKNFLKNQHINNFYNEILSYYYKYLCKINDKIQRTTSPNTWGLIEWQSFFENYNSSNNLIQPAEIQRYRKEYFYIKLLLGAFEGQKTKLPCLEIRSRDVDFENNLLKVKVVLYNTIEECRTPENITKWKNKLKENGIQITNRQDILKHKQIGYFCVKIENREESIQSALDKAGETLIKLFGE